MVAFNWLFRNSYRYKFSELNAMLGFVLFESALTVIDINLNDSMIKGLTNTLIF